MPIATATAARRYSPVMVARQSRRFWRIYWENYRQERAAREARERAVPGTTASRGFWITLGLALMLNFIEAVVDPDGSAWKALRYIVGLVWLIFAAWYLSEVLSRWREGRAE